MLLYNTAKIQAKILLNNNAAPTFILSKNDPFKKYSMSRKFGFQDHQECVL